MKQSSILDSFPKNRIRLPPGFQKIYIQHYLINREGKSRATSFSKRMESWMHKKVAADVVLGNTNLSTLEIGAGTLNQLKYEPVRGVYDIIEPFNELFENSPSLKHVRTVYKDINDINNKKYDRITSVAVFEHIMDLPFVIAKAITLLGQGGHVRVAIPNEGTVMWKIGTKITGFEFKKKYGLDYQILMKYEHVNTADDIEKVLEYFFGKVTCSVLGISKKFAFYRFYNCSHPCTERATNYFIK